MGRVEHDHSRSWTDGGGDALELQVERRRLQAHTNWLAPRGQDEHLVEEPRRRQEDDLVSRLNERAQRDCYRGEPAVGHGYVGGIPFHAGTFPKRARDGAPGRGL